MKKGIFIGCSLLVILLASLIISCSKEHLQSFPDDQSDTSDILLVRKPTGIAVTALFDHQLSINWQNINAGIKEIEIRYLEEGKVVTQTVKDFSKPLILKLKEFKEYNLEFYTIASAKRSNATIIKIWTREPYLLAMINKVKVKTVPGLANVTIPNESKQKLNYRISYLAEGSDSTILNGVFETASYSLNLPDSKGKDFVLKLQNQEGNKSEHRYSLAYKVLSYTSEKDKENWTIYTDSPGTSPTNNLLDKGFDGITGLGPTAANFTFRSGTGTSPRSIYFHFTQARIASEGKFDEINLKNPNGPFDQYMPSLLNISFLRSTTATVALNTIDIYGINAKKEKVLILKDYDLNYVKTSIDYLARIPLPLIEPFIGLQLTFNVSETNSLAINEINFDGYPF